MFKKNKKIIFQEATDAAKYLLDMPSPSTKNIPKWYKDQKLFSNDQNSAEVALTSNGVGTYKLCVPLIDSLTAGYQIVTPCDLLVTNKEKNGYEPFITWYIGWDPIDVQNFNSLGNFPVPLGHHSMPYRWSVDWKIITPSGYSLWVTHPSQRYDLPFTTLTSFVDTDKLPNKMFFPFFIKHGFEGVIPKGTPIVQIIPIKRESWKSQKKEYQDSIKFIFNNIMKTNFIRVYKHNFWTKKDYK